MQFRNPYTVYLNMGDRINKPEFQSEARHRSAPPLLYIVVAEAVLTCTNNLCFESKIRKIGIPLPTSVFLYKSGGLTGYTFYGHVFYEVSINAIFSYVKRV